MPARTLDEQRRIWEGKPVLRAVYADYYRRIGAACRPGPTLEVGGGSGNLKAFLPAVLSTDIVPEPWLDAVADAQALPFTDGAFANIVMVDVLHHIARPARFLAEAARVLEPGGRLILVEPAITPLSWFFFRLFHPEPVMLGADPLDGTPPAPGRTPLHANQAIATLLFGRHRARMARLFPELETVHRERLSLLAYPLSGGFRRWRLIPAAWVAPLLRLEHRLIPLLGPLAAFRLFVVVERRSALNRPAQCP